jgi:GDP-L-fucose synthase
MKTNIINKVDQIFLTGHNGLVGSAVLRNLKKKGFKNILVVEKKNLDLRDQNKVLNFFSKNKDIKAVINAAGKVGGIYANSNFGGEFIYDNLTMQNNIIHGSYLNKINNLIFLGSSCIYPKTCKQPIKEEFLLTGKLESTNEAYAIAKIAGIKLCENYNFQFKTNYKCLMPCNLYGPNDNFDLKNSHFYAALIHKIYNCKIKKAKKLILWGKKNTKRELMHVDDLANACIFFLNKKTKESLINIGVSKEMTIGNYAKFIMKKLKIKLEIQYDATMPSGNPRKIVDNSIAKKYGWKPKISLDEGFYSIYQSFLEYKK